MIVQIALEASSPYEIFYSTILCVVTGQSVYSSVLARSSNASGIDSLATETLIYHLVTWDLVLHLLQTSTTKKCINKILLLENQA